MNFPQNMVLSNGVVYIGCPHPFDGLSQERLMLPNMIGVLRRDVGMKSYLSIHAKQLVTKLRLASKQICTPYSMLQQLLKPNHPQYLSLI